MSLPRAKSAMLMTKGIMDVRSDPPRLICTILKYQHPGTKKEVTLYPVPNIAAPSYFQRVLNGEALQKDFDKVLCEDGRLPFQAGTVKAARQRWIQLVFPFFSVRPVVEDGEKFDGIVSRDAVESRMAYQMVLDGYDPPVDPRARRAVERIDSYPDNTRVVVPWGVYHMPYFRYRLEKEGYAPLPSEEVVVFGFQQMLSMLLVTSAAAFVLAVLLFSIFFW
ncbi:putative mitochondrial hypothetical protein [Leptomonas pyrrhocoris]|uniref:Uncharacterized protein n=1 Tax=Leptomonas pyrrhocoris TaxID=157538 RepID=A0A0M9G7P7_LEPPY|nr:putative mitochondrial hypothetical protein [Leptomonas pyrrhocoris]XP_015662538.1 putative mitochondrial hypothetical protein [Leptomonas pyrrhocoris]XP_015662539.1 putative mitochondrial hypothetical protein [Leptomonas pyrrhocoris]XP_015662540.1 putative mitochondrial hypothetical protein [Leptomonas pyrrhocoris]XP_015662541.1 putative mitochondrial hypothetical protein [Leptomonas pyrrhocoris]KPA84098.1 putative mitochondrial hypothetical protein [Leptomonas pyrrhocoris]KPA84099.1 puta|eukprot:XP_015662537.1 putative mitochondrial hypothetical protein [Leptomonas pyrrhocoris]